MCNPLRVRLARTLLFGGLLTAALLPSGCAQMALIGLLVGGYPMVEPEFDHETKESLIGKDQKVAVICYADPKIRLKYAKIDREVATYVSRVMQAHKIKIIEPDYVHEWIDKHSDWERPEELARDLKADYVVEIELASFDLYAPHSATLYRGSTEAYINVHKLRPDGRGDKVFTKELNFMFPTKVPRSTNEQPELSFKREYLSRLAEEIGFKFYPYENGDRIPWAS